LIVNKEEIDRAASIFDAAIREAAPSAQFNVPGSTFNDSSPP
jgi:hypothetical protein